MTNNNSSIEQIKTLFKAYEAIQTKHIHIMRTEALPDLDTMTRDRETAFLELKQALDQFMATLSTQGKSDMIQELENFEKNIQSVARLDEILTNEVQTYKERLKKHLNQLKQGKTAMSGYRPQNPNANRPHVFSMIR